MIDEQIFCPTCGNDTDHTLIKSGQENLVRCEECQTVHSIQIERERLVNVRVIVNRDEKSESYIIKIPAKDELHIGDELLVDDPSKDVVMTQISSLETDRRVQFAQAENVKTIWARATDEVPLRISVYRSGKSHSLKVSVPGDEEIAVGEIRAVEGRRFSVVKIKLRGEGFADAALARDIQRVWGRGL